MNYSKEVTKDDEDIPTIRITAPTSNRNNNRSKELSDEIYENKTVKYEKNELLALTQTKYERQKEIDFLTEEINYYKEKLNKKSDDINNKSSELKAIIKENEIETKEKEEIYKKLIKTQEEKLKYRKNIEEMLEINNQLLIEQEEITLEFKSMKEDILALNKRRKETDENVINKELRKQCVLDSVILLFIQIEIEKKELKQLESKIQDGLIREKDLYKVTEELKNEIETASKALEFKNSEFEDINALKITKFIK